MRNDSVERYPLTWPPGRPRTKSYARNKPRFTARSMFGVRRQVEDEVRLLGGRDLIISSNVQLRRDGAPLANQRIPEDPGVAVYFKRKGKDVAIACDRWQTPEENLRAIGDAINAIRLIERRGTGEMVDAAFQGFAQLPAAMTTYRHWTQVLGVSPEATSYDITQCYRSLAAANHPDRGGHTQTAAEINAAYEEFKKERGL